MAEFIAPAADLAPLTEGRTTAFGDPIQGGTPPSAQRASSIGDAVKAGLQSSATGLAIRGQLPSQQLGEDAPWYHRLAAGAANVAADLPLSVVGAVAGGAAGTTAAGPAGTLVGGGAGAFAVPMALRDALIEAYSHNHAMSWSGVWEIAKAAMSGGAKGAVIGGATMGAGAVAARTVGAALAPSIGTSLTVRGGTAAITAAGVGTELATLTTASAALEGHMPTWQDFMDNAILLGGMKASVAVAGKLRNIYAETGRTPEQVAGDAARDPVLRNEILEQPLFQGLSLAQMRDTLAEKHPGVSFTLGRDTKGGIHLADIAAKVTGQGDGPRAMTDFVRYLDENKLPSSLTATETSKTPLAKIVEFYERFGYTKDDVQPFRDGVVMHREPRDATAAAVSRDAQNAGGNGRIPGKRAGAVAEPSGIPSAYRGAALEQRIAAAVDADPRPELIRKNIAGSEDWTPPGTGNLADPVRYDYISDRPTAQGVLRAVTELYQREITEQTRGVVPNTETATAGLRMATDGVLAPHVVGKAGNAAEIYARAHLLRGATNHAVTELQKIAGLPDAELTPTAKLGALAALERVAMLKAEIEGVGAEAGRALQIFRAMKRDPSLLGEANQLLALAERKGALQDIARIVATLRDPAQIAEFVRPYVKATTTEKVMEAWKAAILTGPQTHLANLFGNMTKWAVEIPENIVAATLTAAGRAAKGDPLTMAQWKARALSSIYGVMHGSREALTVAAEVWRQKGEHVEKADVYRTAIEGKTGDFVRLPFRALQVEDALFRTVAERAESYKMAVDRVVKEGLHPETAEGRAKIVEYTARPESGLSDAAAAKAIERVQQAGAEGVFAQRLGPFLEQLQGNIARNAPLVGLVVPFVRTPANLVSWAIQHAPGLNLLSSRWRGDFAAGGEKRAQAIARVVVGTGLAATAYALAQDGLLTGGGMFDKEEGGVKRAAGWQPYSAKIGDKFYSYQRIEPVAKVLGMAADLIELQQATKDDADRAKIATMLVLMFGNATVSTTYLSGLSNAMNALIDPARYGENYLEGYATSLVPKIVGQTAAMIDPHKREVDGVLDAIQSQIPHLREKLMPKRDVWGEPAENGRWFAVMPVATSDVSSDKVKTEAARLELAISDAPKFLMEKGPFNPKEKRVELTPEQRDVFRQVSGKNAMAILGPIVNAPDWERIPDFAKAAIYKDVIEGTRKQAAYAALPADDAARMQLREKIVNKIIKQTQDAQAR